MDVFRKASGVETRWSSFENIAAAKGAGGRENDGAKGHPHDTIKAHSHVTLLDVKGSGIVRRIWMGLRDLSPFAMRALVIEMYWDDAPTPAVCAPLQDFFCVGLGRRTTFENEFFVDPEGRSFVCYVPMPFRKAARIIIRNETDKDMTHLFFDVNLTLGERHDPGVLYFHAHWRRETLGELGVDFDVLPKVHGAGRYLGACFSVITNPIWKGLWWGEGEVKVYLDGDQSHPTLVNTGTEDYISTSAGQAKFSTRYSGCTIADEEHGQWSFYRLHLPDPVYFHKDCRVTIQRMGGARKAQLLDAKAAGAELRMGTVIQDLVLYKVWEMDPPAKLEDQWIRPDAWCNVYRRDDWAAVAYFYLDAPENHLGPIQPMADRIAGILDTTAGHSHG